MRERLRDSYSESGRPSIDPKLLLRILLIGYLFECRITLVPKRPDNSLEGGSSLRCPIAGWTVIANLP